MWRANGCACNAALTQSSEPWPSQSGAHTASASWPTRRRAASGAGASHGGSGAGTVCGLLLRRPACFAASSLTFDACTRAACSPAGQQAVPQLCQHSWKLTYRVARSPLVLVVCQRQLVRGQAGVQPQKPLELLHHPTHRFRTCHVFKLHSTEAMRQAGNGAEQSKRANLPPKAWLLCLLVLPRAACHPQPPHLQDMQLLPREKFHPLCKLVGIVGTHLCSRCGHEAGRQAGSGGGRGSQE